MSLRAVFLDVDGVILDPVRTGAEWGRLCGDIYAEEFGGSAEAWGRANQETFPAVWETFDMDAFDDPGALDRALTIELVARLCDQFGVPRVDDDRAAAISRRIDVYVAERIQSQVPGAADAIRALGERFDLHTATGNVSYRVDALLRGMGVRPLFGVTAGPDLVGVRKYRPGFYEPIFALAGVTPAEAVVVDDHPDALVDAAAAGAATVYVPRPGAAVPSGFDAVVGSIRDLPAALEALPAGRGGRSPSPGPGERPA